MAPTPDADRPGRRRDERGSTLIEAAFVMPIFLMLVFGVVEFAGVIMTKSGTTNAVQAAARMASVEGNDALADRQILLRLQNEAAGLPGGEIEQIVIWHAAGPGSTPPANCTALNSAGIDTGGGGVGSCNVYNDPEEPGGAFAKAHDPLYKRYFGCPSAPDDGYNSQRLDCHWAPQARKVKQGLPGTPAGSAGIVPDYVGVYVRAKHNYYTGFFGKAVTVEEQSVGRIEPQQYVSTL